MKVNPAALSLGCMNFGKRTDRATSLRILGAAFDAGIEWFDTANMYVEGESERIVGAALRGRRGQVRVATKVGLGRVSGHSEGLAPARVLAACDESLGRIGIDTIDLYYLHAPDAGTPFEATLEAVAALLECGKIRSWGVSNFASWQILELHHLAARMGIPRPAAAQQMYNALVRQLDIEYFAFTARYPIHTTVFNPLAGGLLAGGCRQDAPPAAGSRFEQNAMYRRRYWQGPMFAAVEALAGLAAKQGCSVLDLAYAFLFRHPGVDSVLVGPATEAHLAAALHAQSVPLPPDVRREIDAIGIALAGTDARYAR